jgi:hypothetical protein
MQLIGGERYPAAGTVAPRRAGGATAYGAAQRRAYFSFSARAPSRLHGPAP